MPSKYQNRKFAAKAALTALGATGVLAGNTNIAHADKVIVGGNISGAGTTHFADNTEVANQSQINTVNSELRNVQVYSHGVIQFTSTIKDLPDSQIPHVRDSIAKLGTLIRKYNSLKDELNTQNNTNQALNGERGVDPITYINNPDDIDSANAQLQDVLNQMQDAINYNNQAVGENAQNVSQNRALQDKVNQANQTITGAAGSLKHYHDGIWGNMDDVKRKSEDSRAQDGIDVDNTDTQRANTIQTSQTVLSDQKLVTSIEQADQELDRILNNIRQQNAENVEQGQNARTYRGHAFYNIDDINVWLQELRQKAEEANQKAQETNQKVMQAMDEYKSKMKDIYQQEVNKAKSKGKVSSKSLAEINKNMDAINSSSVTKDDPIQVSIGTVEFGDIGQPQDVENGAQDGTIERTKEVEKQKLLSAIDNAMSQVNQSADDALSAIENTLKANEDAIKNGAEEETKPTKGTHVDGSKLKLQGPFDKEFLKKMPIYRAHGKPGEKYRELMDHAVNQLAGSLPQLKTEEQTGSDGKKTSKVTGFTSPIQSLVKKLSGSGFVKKVSDGTSAAEMAAAVYTNNVDKTGKAPGFGSVMFKTSDIFDYIKSKPSTLGHGHIYMMTGDSGNSEKLYNDFIDHTHSTFGNAQAVRDWYRQYLYPKHQGESRNTEHRRYNHAKKTFTVISDSPIIKFKLNNAYVYAEPAADPKQPAKIKSADVNVTIEAHAFNGDNLTSRIRQNLGNKSAYALYIYNVAINPYTGQLAVGTSYIPAQRQYVGTGTGGHASGGHGEGMMLTPLDTTITATETPAADSMMNSDNALSVIEKSSPDQLINDAIGTNGQALKSINELEGGNLFRKVGSLIDSSFARNVGLAQTVHVEVEGGGRKSANYAPLFVSDIDDDQELVVPAGNNDGRAHLATAHSVTTKRDHSNLSRGRFNWNLTGHHHSGHDYYVKYGSNNYNSTLTLDHPMTMRGATAMLYSKNGLHDYGLGDQWLTMRNLGKGSDHTYLSIDTNLFIPFGFIAGGETPPHDTPGKPGKKKKIELKPVNVNIKTMHVDKPNAHGYTKGTYNLSSAIEFLRTTEIPPKVPKNMSAEITLPTFKGLQPKDKIASSNTSIVIRRGDDINKHTSSGNSLTVTSRTTDKRTSSGNSLVIKSNETSLRTSSGNSLVIRSKTENVRTSSGNSLTVRVITPIGKIKHDGHEAMLLPVASDEIGVKPEVKQEDNRTQIAMSVYVDPEIANTAKAALTDWQNALKDQGLDLATTITSDPAQLKRGVTLAIMNSVSGNEIVSSYQKPNTVDTTMQDFAGLTTAVANDILTGNGENDVFNARGNITTGEVLKNTKFTIQLNSQGLKGNIYTGPLDKGQMMIKVLKHELGHVFGLSHNNQDTLMTTDVLNKKFDGQISAKDAQMAAESMKKDFLHPADLFKKK